MAKLPETLNQFMLPSGVPVGQAGPGVTALLLARGYKLPHSYPIIEEGDYEDFEQCVLRACSRMVFDIKLEDFTSQCQSDGVEVRRFDRKWVYDAQLKPSTTISAMFQFRSFTDEAVYHYLKELSLDYGFIFNRLQISRERNYMEPWKDIAVAEAELVWPTWT
jgi:hypothetical protein